MRLDKLLYFFIVCIFLFASLAMGKENAQALPKEQKVSFLQFKDIKLENLFDYMSAKYSVNIIVEDPIIRHYTTSINLKNVGIEDIFDVLNREFNLNYTKKGESYYIALRQKYHEENQAKQEYLSEKVKIEYAALTDIILFLNDVMKGSVIIRNSTQNEPYSNLFDGTPSTQKSDSKSSMQSSQSNEGVVPQNTQNKMSTGVQLTNKNQDNKSNMINMLLRQEATPKNMLYIIPFYNENNLYLVSSDKELIDRAKRYIKENDVQIKEVLIQGKIIGVDIGNGFSSFLEFSQKTGDAVSSSIRPQGLIQSTGGFYYGFLDSRIELTLQMLESKNKAKTIASPIIMTANRNKANLQLTEEVSIIKGWSEATVTQSQGGGQVVTLPTPEYEQQDIGTAFEVTPFINENNEVLLKIKITVSTLKRGSQQILVQNGSGGYDIKYLDGVGKTTMETTLLTTDAKAIVLGGLANESTSKQESKIPILGDIPGLGLLFKDVEDVTSKNETIVILTPFIIDSKNPKAKENMKKLQRDREESKEVMDDNKTIPNKLIENLKGSMR